MSLTLIMPDTYVGSGALLLSCLILLAPRMNVASIIAEHSTSQCALVIRELQARFTSAAKRVFYSTRYYTTMYYLLSYHLILLLPSSSSFSSSFFRSSSTAVADRFISSGHKSTARASHSVPPSSP